jgi:hypothetical protein
MTTRFEMAMPEALVDCRAGHSEAQADHEKISGRAEKRCFGRKPQDGHIRSIAQETSSSEEQQKWYTLMRAARSVRQVGPQGQRRGRLGHLQPHCETFVTLCRKALPHIASTSI